MLIHKGWRHDLFYPACNPMLVHLVQFVVLVVSNNYVVFMAQIHSEFGNNESPPSCTDVHAYECVRGMFRRCESGICVIILSLVYLNNTEA